MSRFPFRQLGDRSAARAYDTPILKPMHLRCSQPMGYAAPAQTQILEQAHHRRVANVTKRVLDDTYLLERLSTRVYELWKEDYQKDRDRF